MTNRAPSPYAVWMLADLAVWLLVSVADRMHLTAWLRAYAPTPLAALALSPFAVAFLVQIVPVFVCWLALDKSASWGGVVAPLAGVVMGLLVQTSVAAFVMPHDDHVLFALTVIFALLEIALLCVLCARIKRKGDGG